jgi:hypothetical protein
LVLLERISGMRDKGGFSLRVFYEFWARLTWPGLHPATSACRELLVELYLLELRIQSKSKEKPTFRPGLRLEAGRNSERFDMVNAIGMVNGQLALERVRRLCTT